MPQTNGPRLESRDHRIWTEYLCGESQPDLAAKYKLAQQRISQIITAERAKLSSEDLADVAREDLERVTALLSAYMPAAVKGDTRAGHMALKVLERKAKMLGTDATEPLTLVLERRDADMVALVADALSEALAGVVGALHLAPHEARFTVELEQYGRDLATWALDGRQGPRPVAPVRPAPPVQRVAIGELMPPPDKQLTDVIERALSIIDADIIDDDMEAAS